MLRTAVARPALALRTSVRHFSSSSLRAAESGKDPQLGDYPDLPFVSLQRRKYSPKWFDPQEKRNYGETLHEQDDYLSVWAPDAHAMPASSALRQLLFVAGVFAAAATAIYVGRPDRPSIPREYPRDGLATELAGAAARTEGSFSLGGDEEEAEEDE